MTEWKGSVQTIAEVVAKHYDVTLAQIFGVRRSAAVARPRQIVMTLACDLVPECSTAQIGRALRRDHTTVISGRRVIMARAARDPDFAGRLDDLRTACRAALAHRRAMIPVIADARANAETIAREMARQFTRSVIKMAREDPDGFAKAFLPQIEAAE